MAVSGVFFKPLFAGCSHCEPISSTTTYVFNVQSTSGVGFVINIYQPWLQPDFNSMVRTFSKPSLQTLFKAIAICSSNVSFKTGFQF